MKKIRKEINDNLPQVDKFLSDTGETILKTLDKFLNDVVKGAEDGTRLNSSHKPISYAVFCLKKKKKKK